MYPTTFGGAVAAVSGYFYAALAATEDFDAFCSCSYTQMRLIAAAAVAFCIERFDAEIAAAVPRSWERRGRPSRRIVMLFGEVEYERSLFRDEYGRNRYPTDEILGIPKRARFSADAFLWMVRRAAAVSFRRVAVDFAEMSGTPVSAMCVWRAVQHEAELIRKDRSSAAPGDISQTDVFAESDGLWIALQSSKRREAAISRFLYEQSHTKMSFEMKCGVVYAGISKAGKRNVRGNVALVATCGSSDDFRDSMRAAIESDYVVEDIETIHFSSDGGQWCKAHGLGGLGRPVFQGIDSFHVMRNVHRAFPEGAGREHLVSLALRCRPEAFSRACDRILPQVENAKRRERIRECRDYVANNAELLRGGGSLGTMEATSASVWAKRMKSFGCAWSKAGAESMALLLCRVCAGRPLVAPPKDAFFTQPQQQKAAESIAKRGADAARRDCSGRGWEPPSATYVLEKAPGRYMPTSFLSARVR